MCSRPCSGPAASSPPSRCLTPRVGGLRNVEVTRWRNGGAEIVSIFRHAGLPQPARVALPGACYVYDLKGRKDLGRLKSLDLRITPYRAQFLVLGRTALSAAEVSVPKASVAPGTVAVAKVVVPKGSGTQAVKLQVKLPDGTPADWLERVVVADRGGVAVKLPIALNDPTGLWTVTATELYTNHAGVCRFTVK